MDRIDRCQYCGATNGYYIKERFYGTYQRSFAFDHTPYDCADMTDSAQFKVGKYAYCECCNKRLFPVTDEILMLQAGKSDRGW